MDGDKKRKKNKKKNKQNKSTNNTVSGAAGETVLSSHSYVNGTEQDERKLATECSGAQADGELSTEVDLDKDCYIDSDGSLLSEAEKQPLLDREVNLEGNIENLQKELDAHKKREVSLVEKIENLQNELDAHKNREVTLAGKIENLQNELDAHKNREANLELNIVEAQNEKVSCFEKQADLQTTIILLQTEKSSWLQKEASYENRINQLMDEVATSSSERLSLQEKIELLEREKDSWAQMETAGKETIASLNDDNGRLRAQVLELEASRSNLLHQNQQLMESITGLRIQVQNLDSANADLSSASATSAVENQQLEAARVLVEKLLAEKAQLVEKVSDLYIELDQKSVTAGPSLPADSDSVAESAQITILTESGTHGTDPVVDSIEPASTTNHSDLETDPLPTLAEEPASGADPMTTTAERSDRVRVPGPMFEIIKRTLSVERLDSIEDTVVKPKNDGSYINDADYSRASVESSEIVQIPLDENEIQIAEVESPQIDAKTDVPLTDAPLIGAPFRLISYFARYVSGADLVNKSSLDSQR